MKKKKQQWQKSIEKASFEADWRRIEESGNNKELMFKKKKLF